MKKKTCAFSCPALTWTDGATLTCHLDTWLGRPHIFLSDNWDLVSFFCRERSEAQEQVVEKQDMEKLEKEAGEEGTEEVEVEVNRRGRFNVGNIKVVKVVKETAGAALPEAPAPAKEAEVAVEEVAAVAEKDSTEEPEDAKGEEETEPEVEEAKAIDQGPDPDQRYLKFDEEIGRGSFKTVFKGQSISGSLQKA